MRVSDADRDAAVTELGDHFQVGRLTQEEFDERSGVALRARTGSDLSQLFGDLPSSVADPRAEGPQPPAAELPPPWQPEPMPWEPAGRRRPAGFAGLIAALVVIAVLGLGGGLGHHHHGVWGLLIPVIVIVAVVARRAGRPWR
jgi:hypothetical protein